MGVEEGGGGRGRGRRGNGHGEEMRVGVVQHQVLAKDVPLCGCLCVWLDGKSMRTDANRWGSRR